MSEFNTGLPSVRQIQKFIKEKASIQVGLITDKTMNGKILWQDNQSMCLLDSKEQKVIIWLQAIAYVKPAE